jgi:hypothetical protein
MSSQARTLDESDQLMSLNNKDLPPGVTKSSEVGGNGGTEFSQAFALPFRIREVRIGSQKLIDSLQLVVYAGPNNPFVELVKNGGSGGRIQSLNVDLGHYIESVDVRYGEVIDHLTFKIVGGAVPRYAEFGGSGGQGNPPVTLGGDPRTEEICGFFGKAGEFIDSIGVYIRKRQ